MLGKKKKIKEEENEAETIKSTDRENDQQIDLIKEILENTQASIKKALSLLKEKNIDTNALLDSLKETRQATKGAVSLETGSERIIEGVFNGEKMIAGDGIEYNIAANYASKSKLVEGDILKLTIRKDGSFVYKQIGPVERRQLVAVLARNDGDGEWYGILGQDRWKLLTASVTYFHGSGGDEVVILTPKEGKSKWAAVENVIKSH
ncbi:MAG: hypothetical protein A3J65_03215 [Candidatus Buchananbacteria bacterium RIFCSPHIGHO2_02_FULL_45_11b]|uniref:50S ribosomal protein L7/L12 n=4 Tax=Candidatus Buchananiibacteriota TaxID=1817903 RepID=A0A1G1Y6E0_9BACT|nr:MAG: hypothetical protein A2663_04935 [Candidatus Buchananbacteria bacterium RIFCSPHIGHO2_01_FULL_46_12]OGY49890.1 MAG: hypothetical protein A3J65_03215 [Candidatus Buchananbacteria bacterium RIFCSPHIGHO2_02_FULL_45_11b]OGY54011.1 MAG: hypothetical protein A3B15_01645 [Candidatus Buchananbacteria bacterium RIFCSPLOWO2_01_FULL_45_31]OGY57573.1 MAG: hypothetical protein A3H67_00805 [Candidatus Buchananbacteria bacterium RIFCSPLOWO2_02_FULL_46_11b]